MYKKFEIHSNFEKDGYYFIEVDFGELKTRDRLLYKKVIEDGYIIAKIDYWEEAY